MDQVVDSELSALIAAINQFSVENPRSVIYAKRGQRIINEGETGSDLYLIRSGTVRVLAFDQKTQAEIVHGGRKPGDIVGEGGFLQRNATRMASIEVYSDEVELVRIKREEVFALIKRQPEVKKSLIALAEMFQSRTKDTSHILQGVINIEVKWMSVLMGDIHNFSLLSTAINEEFMSGFLFDFIEYAEEIVGRFTGYFEDQGDGYKSLFLDDLHATKAVQCAIEIAKCFHAVRDDWSPKSDAFRNIGLGMGVCTDIMSIRKRIGSVRPYGRILSHSINIAAMVSKHRSRQNDVEIFIDDNSLASLPEGSITIDSVEKIPLEKISSQISMHKISHDMYVPRFDPGEINNHILLLETYRKNLGMLIQQRAMFGAAFVPLPIMNQIQLARAEIQKIKSYLRRFQVTVDDRPGDDVIDIPTLADL